MSRLWPKIQEITDKQRNLRKCSRTPNHPNITEMSDEELDFGDQDEEEEVQEQQQSQSILEEDGEATSQAWGPETQGWCLHFVRRNL